MHDFVDPPHRPFAQNAGHLVKPRNRVAHLPGLGYVVVDILIVDGNNIFCNGFCRLIFEQCGADFYLIGRV